MFDEYEDLFRQAYGKSRPVAYADHGLDVFRRECFEMGITARELGQIEDRIIEESKVTNSYPIAV